MYDIKFIIMTLNEQFILKKDIDIREMVVGVILWFVFFVYYNVTDYMWVYILVILKIKHILNPNNRLSVL